MALFAAPFGLEPEFQITLQTLREATQAQRKLQLHYRDANAQTSVRVVRPLGCFYWGKLWTLAAWCESRSDFRNFRLDRIESAALVDATRDPQAGQFRVEAGKTLADFLRKMTAQQRLSA